MMRLTHFNASQCGRIVTFFAAIAVPGSVVIADPQPGEVYREYATHQGGDDWRVTNPNARQERAHRHLPNPVLHIAIGDLEGAVRAEAMFDRWGGHTGTTQKRIRFNGNEWLTLPEISTAPGDLKPERLYVQDNPVIDVPLSQLKEGDNTFEGTCSHQEPDGWGQWGLYSLIVRVYYDPSTKQAPTGRIVSPSSGGTFGENPIMRVEASSPGGVGRVDVLAFYDGYDENGDGVFADWHGGYFQPMRGQPADLREHVGTAWRMPYDIAWDTRWVPDQKPGAVKLIARIQDSRGLWFVTQPVENLNLVRRGESVKMYRSTGIGERFGVRNGATRKCVMHVPSGDMTLRIIEVGMAFRTWHGWDGHHEPLRFNDHSLPIDGKNHHYDYDVLPIPSSAIRSGDNTLTLHSKTEHHMLEVHWPGPALMVRYAAR